MNFPPRRFLRWPYAAIAKAIKWHPFFDFDRQTQDHVIPKSFDMWWVQYVVGRNIGPYWPVDPTSRVYNWRNVRLGVDSAPGYMPGCYIQAFDSISIGNYVRIAPSVGIITGNHDIYDQRKHVRGPVSIGDYCWIAVNSTILVNTELGPFTIVAANSVVNRSYPDGHVVLAGSPARPITELDPSKCVRHENQHKYVGYIKEHKYDAWAKENLHPPFGDFGE